MFSGISVDNLIGRIITGKGVDGCSCMINESILLRTLLLSCTEVNGSPGECIVTGHGFERKSWGGGRKKTEVIEASNQCCLLALPPSGSRVYIHICMYVCVYIFFSSCKCKTVDGNKLLLRNATERMERVK